MKTFLVIGGECPRRKVDAQTVHNYFLANSLTAVKQIKLADIIYVCSCGAFNTSEQKSLVSIDKILSECKTSAKVIVGGCLVGINPKALGDRDVIHMPYPEISKLDKLINASHKYKSLPDANLIKGVPGLLETTSIRDKVAKHFVLTPKFFLKAAKYVTKKVANKLYDSESVFSNDIYNIMIARGCLGNCSYCAIKYAHGPIQSKPMSVIIKQFKEGLAKGYKKFVLIGEDIGAYGVDRKTSIVKLLTKLFAIKGDYQIILNDLNPQWLIRYDEDLITILEKNIDRIVDLRLPIQSGSNSMLKRMRRPYKIEQVKRILNKLKLRIPQLKLYTHILVGFPGETEAEFNASVEFVKEYKFEQIALYCFQDREVTDAHKFKGHLSEELKLKRMKAIKKVM